MTMLEKIADELLRWADFGDGKTESRKNAILAARAAVEAMREPTDDIGAAMLRIRKMVREWPNLSPQQMELAASVKFEDHARGNPTHWCKPEWRAGIDAILTEPQHD